MAVGGSVGHMIGEWGGEGGWTGDWWVFRLFLNLLCYGSLIGIITLFLKFLKHKGYLTKAEELARTPNEASCLYRLLAVFAVEQDRGGELPSPGGSSPNSTTKNKSKDEWDWREYGILLFCFFGLQISYLTWGVTQEKIMTQNYVRADMDNISGNVTSRFKDSLFLVFLNRVSACLLSGLAMCAIRQGPHRAPLYKYSYASFSNIMSSWFQYEALKFITFPAQVLGKASKIIPVMLMGKLVSKQTYPLHQYMTSGLISLGVSMFLLSRAGDTSSGKNLSHTTTFSGILLMIGYLTFDSFTSNWQGSLFRQYRMSSLQMMCGVNFFSSVLTIYSLIAQGNFMTSVHFLLNHYSIVTDIALLSFCGAIGQLFIFYTISKFGAVTFTIITTIRQAAAIFLSCLIYGHQLNVFGIFGVFVVFTAMLLRPYLNRKFGSKAEVRRTVSSRTPELDTDKEALLQVEVHKP